MVPAGGGGTFLGGYMVKKWNMRCRDIVRVCVACTAASLVTTFVFLVHCPDVPMAGVTVPYRSGPWPVQNQRLYNRLAVQIPAPLEVRRGSSSGFSSLSLTSAGPPWRRT